MRGGADPADALDQEDGLLEVLGLRELLYAPVVVADLDVQVDDRLALHVQLEELGLLL